MKQHFINFKIDVFCEGQKAGNENLVLFHHLKYRFIDFTKVAFSDIKSAENEFSGPFVQLETSLQ
jgi:hypothetical protein